MGFSFLKISKVPDSKTLELLSDNVIGTPGRSMLYRHLGVHEKIHKIHDPYFVSLERNDQLIGTCCFCRRPAFNNGVETQSYYVRYFSFLQNYRGAGSSKKRNRSSLLRREVISLLDGEGLKDRSEKFFHYAYVDPRNVRSRQLCDEFGFEKVSQYATVLFSRISPRQSKYRVSELTKSEEDEMRRRLARFYRDYSMFSFENLLGLRKYYVVKSDNGEILAGLQATPDHWQIISLPGIAGAIMLPLFSRLPILNRLLNRRYQFLSIEGIYFEKGYERLLADLIEDLLRKFNRYSAIMVVDPGSELYRVLKSLDLGAVNKLNREVRGDIICRFSNFDETTKNNLKTKRAYISVTDVT